MMVHENSLTSTLTFTLINQKKKNLSLKKKKQKHLDIWLVMTGILCSYLVLLGGIGYTHVSAFDAINATYLSAAYPLITTFWCLGVLKFLEDMIEYFFGKNTNKNK